MLSKKNINNLSISGNIWQERSNTIDHTTLSKVIDRYNISNLVARIILNRNIPYDQLSTFLNPKLKFGMPNPLIMKDMDIGIQICTNSILKKESIYIMGDYDVDGITSTAMIYNYLKLFTTNIHYYIPSRIHEGYGGSMNTIKYLIESKAKLVIMVDNGSSSIEEVKLLNANNIKIIILDHHTTPPILPKADAIINPKRSDDTSNLGYLCSAGIAFLFLAAMNTYLKNKHSNILFHLIPNLLNYLDLVALGTVCDMVPITNLNRIYVSQGLKKMVSTNNCGLKSLMMKLDLNDNLNTDCLGFMIGPIINASSRLGQEQLAIKLLTCDNEKEAQDYVNTMYELNLKRQSLEDQIIKEAIHKIESLSEERQKLKHIFIGDVSWPQGLSGIIASRIKDIYQKPTCIYSFDLRSIKAIASGRSIPGVHLGNIVIDAKQNDLLIKGGGHSQAVGFTFDIDKESQLNEFFNKSILSYLNKSLEEKLLTIDSTIPLTSINNNFINSLSILEPFGMEFNGPIFRINSVVIKNPKIIGKYNNHLSFNISNGFYNIRGNKFKSVPSKLASFILNLNEIPVDIIVSIKSNTFQGKTYPCLFLIDIIQS